MSHLHSLALPATQSPKRHLRRTAFVAVQVSEWEGKCACWCKCCEERTCSSLAPPARAGVRRSNPSIKEIASCEVHRPRNDMQLLNRQ